MASLFDVFTDCAIFFASAFILDASEVGFLATMSLMVMLRKAQMICDRLYSLVQITVPEPAQLVLVFHHLRLSSCDIQVRGFHRLRDLLCVCFYPGRIRGRIPSENIPGKYDQSPKCQETVVVYAQGQSIDRPNGEQIDGDESDRATHGVDDEV